MESSLGEKFTSVVASLLVVAAVTTVVLPGRNTPKVIKSFFGGLSKAVSATIGLEPNSNKWYTPSVGRERT